VEPVADPSDEILANRALGGDEDAARILYERCVPALRRRAARSLSPRVRRRVTESDVLQETWLTAFVRLEGFVDRGPGSFRAWLGTILRHKMHDEVRDHVVAKRRSVRREESCAGAAPEDGIASPRSSPSMHAVREERHDGLLAAIDALPPHYAGLLRLVHVDGLTLVEAASRMGRTANSTCKLYGRALERLAAAVAGWVDE
jgi:RNA polymerase sigma-70 factor (subfamily 1)